MSGTTTTRLAVMVAARGRLPFALLHGEPLLAHALRAAAAASSSVTVVADESSRAEAAAVVAATRTGAVIVDPESWWSGRADLADVLHDPLCPLVPAGFLAALVAGADDGRALTAYRPVTDTVKTSAGGRISGTLDRDRLGIVVAPLVLPKGLGSGGPLPPLAFARLVHWMRERTSVGLVRAPSLARRVDDEGGVTLLECVDEIARRVR